MKGGGGPGSHGQISNGYDRDSCGCGSGRQDGSSGRELEVMVVAAARTLIVDGTMWTAFVLEDKNWRSRRLGTCEIEFKVFIFIFTQLLLALVAR